MCVVVRRACDGAGFGRLASLSFSLPLLPCYRNSRGSGSSSAAALDAVSIITSSCTRRLCTSSCRGTVLCMIVLATSFYITFSSLPLDMAPIPVKRGLVPNARSLTQASRASMAVAPSDLIQY